MRYVNNAVSHWKLCRNAQYKINRGWCIATEVHVLAIVWCLQRMVFSSSQTLLWIRGSLKHRPVGVDRHLQINMLGNVESLDMESRDPMDMNSFLKVLFSSPSFHFLAVKSFKCWVYGKNFQRYAKNFIFCCLSQVSFSQLCKFTIRLQVSK